jgi:hypothetical protein
MIIKEPFSIAPSGKISVLTEAYSLVSQKIKNYVLTNTYERPMSPEYGANSQMLVYENFDSMVFSEFKMETLRELQKNISGASILDMRMIPGGNTERNGSNENTMLIDVQYKLPIGGVRSTQLDLVSPLSLTEESPL